MIQQVACILILYLSLLLWGCDASDSANDIGSERAAANGSDNSLVTGVTDQTATQCDRRVEFPFDVESPELVVPYPNNIFTVLDPSSHSGRRLTVDKTFPLFSKYYGLLSYWLKSFETLEGFGLYSDLFVPLPDVELTLNSDLFTNQGQGVFVVVVDSDHPFFGEVAPVYPALEQRYLRLTPSVPLLENTRYAIVVTDAWQKSTELCFDVSSSMARVSNGEVSTSLFDYEPVLTHLEKLGVKRQNILSLSSFSTMPIFADMDTAQDILDDVNSDSPAVLTGWEFEHSDSPLIDAFVHATLETPMFSDDKGVWRNNADRVLAVERTESVDVTLSLPKKELGEYQQPYPLMIYMHGTSKSRRDVKNVSDWFANIGFATIGMDSLCHGGRPNAINNETLCYYEFLSPLSWRDNGRESVAGFLWLLRAIKNLSEVDVIPEGGDGIPDFDVNQVYVTGVSLGAIQGGVLAGLAPEMGGFVFNVAGAKFTDIAFDHSIVKSLLWLTGNIDSINAGTDLTHLIYLSGMVFQSLLDASDPGVFLYNARRLRGKEYNVLQQGAAYDNQVSGLSGASFARAGGWSQVDSSVWDIGLPLVDAPHRGSGFVQYDTADHDTIWRDDDLALDLQSQLQHFLSTLQGVGYGEIVITH